MPALKMGFLIYYWEIWRGPGEPFFRKAPPPTKSLCLRKQLHSDHSRLQRAVSSFWESRLQLKPKPLCRPYLPSRQHRGTLKA